MTQGVCQIRAGQRAEAETHACSQAYELDAGNPVIGFNLAVAAGSAKTGRARSSTSAASTTARRPMPRRCGSASRSSASSNNREALAQLAGQLQRRFPQSREAIAYERGNFND